MDGVITSRAAGSSVGLVLSLSLSYFIAIWSAGLLAIGNFCYATAGSALTYAISYALSRGTLLVSALLGICFYHEFNKADCKTWTVQIFALLCFTAAIIVVASSKSSH